MTQRRKNMPPVIGRAASPLEGISEQRWRRTEKLAELLRPTLGQPLGRVQAERLARRAKISLATLWRHRRRLAEQELTSALLDRPSGFQPDGNRLSADQHAAVYTLSKNCSGAAIDCASSTLSPKWNSVAAPSKSIAPPAVPSTGELRRSRRI